MQQVQIQSSDSASWHFKVPQESTPRQAAKAALALLLRHHFGRNSEEMRRHSLLLRVGSRRFRLAARRIPRNLLSGGDAQHFYFISDIEGCYDSFYTPCLDRIFEHKKETVATLCILGDIPDRSEIKKQIQVYCNEDYGLCRDQDGQVGKQLATHFGQDNVIRILGNRDGNKLRFKNEPGIMQIGIESPRQYPDWKGREGTSLVYTEPQDILKSLGIQKLDVAQLDTAFESFPSLKNCYWNYAQNATPCKELVAGQLFCAHACPPTTTAETTMLNAIYAYYLDKTKENGGMKAQDSGIAEEYCKSTENVDYHKVPERFIADISGPHSARAWQKGYENMQQHAASLLGASKPARGPVVRSGVPAYVNPQCDMNIDQISMLKGVVGHQPVGYFPYMRNGLLCVDVSAANEQGFQGIERESLPMIHLAFTDSQSWTITVKAYIPTHMLDSNARFHTKNASLTNILEKAETEGTWKVVEYTINPELISKYYAADKTSFTNGNNQSYLVGRMMVAQEDSKQVAHLLTVRPDGFNYSYSLDPET